MDKHARLDDANPAWRLITSRLHTLALTLPPRIIATLRLGLRLLALSQPRIWRYALLPIVVAVSLLIAAGSPISWGLVVAEALAVTCALSGWATLRAYRPTPQRDFPYLSAGAGLFAVATLATLPLLSKASGPILALGALALALIALDLARALLRVRLPRAAVLIAHRVLAPILLGLGLVMVTALTQQGQADATLWLSGVTLSLLAFTAIQAHEIVVDGAVADEKAPWRRPLVPLAAAPALAGMLVIAVALPASAPHGLLLALGALPLALVAVTGFWRSSFIPARALAARWMGTVFTLVALGLTAGALASAMVAAASAALIQALGG